MIKFNASGEEDDEYLVVTSKGDFIQINPSSTVEEGLKFQLLGPKYQAKKINNILPI